MRFTRLASLVAGIVLVATALAGVLGRRDDLAGARDDAVRSAATRAAADLDATISRVVPTARSSNDGPRRPAAAAP